MNTTHRHHSPPTTNSCKVLPRCHLSLEDVLAWRSKKFSIWQLKKLMAKDKPHHCQTRGLPKTVLSEQSSFAAGFDLNQHVQLNAQS